MSLFCKCVLFFFITVFPTPLLSAYRKAELHHNSRQEWVSTLYFSYFSMKTYVVGTHWKCLGEVLQKNTGTFRLKKAPYLELCFMSVALQ